MHVISIRFHHTNIAVTMTSNVLQHRALRTANGLRYLDIAIHIKQQTSGHKMWFRCPKCGTWTLYARCTSCLPSSVSHCFI